MMKFQKIVTGFVVQKFDEIDGKNVCTHQEFIAGDQDEYEDEEGNRIEDIPEYEYQPMDMEQPGNTT